MSHFANCNIAKFVSALQKTNVLSLHQKQISETMGIIDRWKQRRAQRRKLKELSRYASMFSTIQKLCMGGMLHWDSTTRRMFIEQPLAVVMMRNADSWHNFIQNLYLYTYYTQSQQAWNDFMLREELAAVRHATAGTLKLTREDIQRIRTARRTEIAQSDMEAPKVEGFEFFVVRAKATTTDDKASLIAVGYFDPEADTVEIAPWAEVAPLLNV